MTEHFRVKAVRWAHGWELYIDDLGVTQVTTLDKAESQVRNWLETRYERDFSRAVIELAPDLGGLENVVREIRAEVAEVAVARTRAAENSRRLARQLRDHGLSVTDTATIMGVSRGRVSQLTS